MDVGQDAKPTESGLQASKLRGARETGVDLLWSELELANTFVTVGETSSNSATAMRNLNNAWLALKSAHQSSQSLDLKAAELDDFRGAYLALCVRLADLQLQLRDS
jgi:hypothetical protein